MSPNKASVVFDDVSARSGKQTSVAGITPADSLSAELQPICILEEWTSMAWSQSRSTTLHAGMLAIVKSSLLCRRNSTSTCLQALSVSAYVGSSASLVRSRPMACHGSSQRSIHCHRFCLRSPSKSSSFSNISIVLVKALHTQINNLSFLQVA